MLSDTMMLGGGRKAAYSIGNSLLFRGGQYLSRTPSVAGNSKLFTVSQWFRLGAIGKQMFLFSTYRDSREAAGHGYMFQLLVDSSGCINTGCHGWGDGPTVHFLRVTARQCSDPSAWYHLVVNVDLANSVQEDRVRIYVNGVRETAFQSGGVLSNGSHDTDANKKNIRQFVGRYWDQAWGGQIDDYAYFWNGSIADSCLIDGAALPPTTFGDFDSLTGSWRPKLVQGVDFGPNGFYLGKPWSAAGAVNDLGTDFSGKGNHWTPTGFLATDVLKDSPTNVYATLNPLNYSASRMALSAGNLVATASNGSGAGSTLRLSSGKWYFETTLTLGSGAYNCVGLFDAAANVNMGLFARDGGWFVGSDGTKYDHGTATTGYGAAAVAGDRLMCAVDMDAGKVWWGKNGTWFSGVPATGTAPAFENLAGKVVYPGVAIENGYSQEINFGQRPFTYTPPSGFKALCTANLPTPVSAAAKQPGKYYACKTFTRAANATTSTITIGWNPDPNNGGSHTLFRIKRSNADAGTSTWQYIDTKRGLDKALYCDQSIGTSTEEAIRALVVATDGTVTFGANWTSSAYQEYLVEAWRVAPEAGFDIVTYTGTGAVMTVPHSAGAVPAFMVIKARDISGYNWQVYHQAVGPTARAGCLNDTGKQTEHVNFWNNTAPTAANFTLGASGDGNIAGQTFIAYIWSEVPGFSAFGSHVGNGAQDGPFDWLGFTPGSFDTKNTTSSGGSWLHLSAAVSPTNPYAQYLWLNLNSAAGSDGYAFDILSSGVKCRGTSINYNSSADTFITAAWAAHPLGAKRVTPATAR